jgi:hypothetical protein
MDFIDAVSCAYHNMLFKSSATLNGASVLAFTSSTLTPPATSISVKPSVKSTSGTASSVIILETHFCPVKGNVQAGWKLIGIFLEF